MSRSQLSQSRQYAQGQITSQSLPVDTKRLRGWPPVDRRLRPPIRKIEQNAAISAGQNGRKTGQYIQVSVDPTRKYMLDHCHRPAPRMCLTTPKKITAMLTVKKAGPRIMDDIKTGPSRSLIHPPIMKRDTRIQRKRQGTAQKIGDVGRYHKGIAAQNILHQGIPECERPLEIGRYANCVQAGIGIDTAARIDFSTCPAPDHINRTRQFMGQPNIILIGKGDPSTVQFRVPQQCHEILRASLTGPANQTDITIGVVCDKPFDAFDGLIGRTIIADPKAPFPMGLGKNGIQLRPDKRRAIHRTKQDMNMRRFQNNSPLTPLVYRPTKNTVRLIFSDRV